MELLNQIEEEKHTDVTYGPIDNQLHVLTLNVVGDRNTSEWADDSFTWRESFQYRTKDWNGRRTWMPHDVMAMLMMADSPYDERILHVKDLVNTDTPEAAAFLLIDTLIDVMQKHLV